LEERRSSQTFCGAGVPKIPTVAEKDAYQDREHDHVLVRGGDEPNGERAPEADREPADHRARIPDAPTTAAVNAINLT
jgi:hypothetical protein